MSTGAASEDEFWALFSTGQIGSPFSMHDKRLEIEGQANRHLKNEDGALDSRCQYRSCSRGFDGLPRPTEIL
jgi:hypothetical protein